MSNTSVVQPSLLSRMNERQVLRTIQERGPLSRAEVARHSGISAPTASRAVESLLRAGLLEEGAAPGATRGRPARKLRLANATTQVLGLVIDAEQCRMVAGGIDGKLHDDWSCQFPTPTTYEALIEAAAESAEQLMERRGVATLGLGISMPGLIDYRHQQGLLSPNVPITNRHSPTGDLGERLGIDCVLVQELHALCLAERHFGETRGIDDFAMLDVTTGVGLGVMSGGRLLSGHSGLAGEIGHITVDADGRQCGCGNRGCLETVACDTALARGVSERLERKLSVEDVIELAQRGELRVQEELDRTCRYLAIGVAAVINLFNPSTLFIHGKLFQADPGFFERLIAETERRALPPSFADCRIIQARGSKRQGAVAAIIDHLTNAVAPEIVTESQYPGAGREWYSAV